MKCPRCKVNEGKGVTWQNGYPVSSFCTECQKIIEEQIAKTEKQREEPCTHQDIIKEYLGGFDTGDYICTKCGLTKSNKKDFYMR